MNYKYFFPILWIAFSFSWLFPLLWRRLLVWCSSTCLFFLLLTVLLEIIAKTNIVKNFSCFLLGILRFQVLGLSLESTLSWFLCVVWGKGPVSFFLFLMCMFSFSSNICLKQFFLIYSWHPGQRSIKYIYVDLFLGFPICSIDLLSVFVPIPYCFKYCRFVICFGTKCEAPSFVLSQDSFGYLGSILVPHEFGDFFFFSKKMSLRIYRDNFESVDHFRCLDILTKWFLLICEHGMSVHLFVPSLIFSSMFCNFQCTSLWSLWLCLVLSIIFFWCYCEWDLFTFFFPSFFLTLFLFFLDNSLLMFRNATDSCMLILNAATLLNSFINFTSFFGGVFRVFYV